MMEAVSDAGAILTVEDGSLKGGLFSEVSEYVSSRGLGTVVKGVGIPDEFVCQAPVSTQRENAGLDADGLYSAILELLKNN